MYGVIFRGEKFMYLYPELSMRIYPGFQIPFEPMRYMVSNFGTVIDAKNNYQVPQRIGGTSQRTIVKLEMSDGNAFDFYVDALVLCMFGKNYDANVPIIHRNDCMYDDMSNNIVAEYCYDDNGRKIMYTERRRRRNNTIFTDEQCNAICKVAQDNPYARPGEIAKILNLTPENTRATMMGINLTITSILTGKAYKDISDQYALAEWNHNYETRKMAEKAGGYFRGYGKC